MKILYVFLFCLIGFVSYNYIYGENGLKKRNEVIASKKIALKKNKNSEIIEEIARSNLGMIKSDEKFYRKVDN